MLYMAIGKLTGKTYAQGTRADCMRQLQVDYPTYRAYDQVSGPQINRNVLPEPLDLRKVPKVKTMDRLG